MARKFISGKDMLFIESLSKELIQEWVAQEVIYYAISEEHTVSHTLYQEAIHKVWFSPVRINARVQFDNPGVDTTNMTMDSKYSLSVFFHSQELEERNVRPREGDFIEYGQIIFEITAVTKPQTIFGQIQRKIMTRLTCIPSREGQMQIYGDSARFIDNTHPVSDAMCNSTLNNPPISRVEAQVADGFGVYEVGGIDGSGSVGSV